MKYTSSIIGILTGLCFFVSPPLMAHCGKCGSDNHAEAQEAQKASTYTCPMHPKVQSSKPGRCPDCGMDLVPVKEGEKGHDEERQHDHSKH